MVATSRVARKRLHELATSIAERHGGVAKRIDLIAAGLTSDMIRAQIAAGLVGWTEDATHISVPSNSRVHRQRGVVIHQPRDVGTVHTAGVPRAQTEVAVIRAAGWACSDRAAATLLAMTVQQRLAHPDRLLGAWSRVGRSRRRAFLEAVIRDVCRGAQSLGELDFAVLCRARGLPAL